MEQNLSNSTELNKNEELEKLLNTKFSFFSYITEESEPGSIICADKLSNLFEEDHLFVQDKPEKVTFTLRDLISKGFIRSGSTDIIDDIDINYPILEENNSITKVSKPKILGKYFHGSRRIKINEKIKVDFELDPKSDSEPELVDL